MCGRVHELTGLLGLLLITVHVLRMTSTHASRRPISDELWGPRPCESLLDSMSSRYHERIPYAYQKLIALLATASFKYKAKKYLGQIYCKRKCSLKLMKRLQSVFQILKLTFKKDTFQILKYVWGRVQILKHNLGSLSDYEIYFRVLSQNLKHTFQGTFQILNTLSKGGYFTF